MSQRLSKFNFQWVEDSLQFKEVFINSCDEKGEVAYILKVDVQYPIKLYELYSDLSFLPERKKLGKVEKLLTSLEDKSVYAIHMKSLKEVLNYRLILKKYMK